MTHQDSDEARQEQILALTKSFLSKPGAIVEGVLGIIVMGVLFFSGFIALGTYLISMQQADFQSRAVSAEAKIIEVSQKERTEATRRPNQQSTRTYHDTILTFEFETPSGTTVARLNDGPSSVYKENDVTTILYDPYNPKKIKLIEKAGSPVLLQRLSQIATFVFIATLLVTCAVAVWRRKTRT